MEKQKTKCAIYGATGNYDSPWYKANTNELYECIDRLIAEGVTEFASAATQGFEMRAISYIINLKKSNPDIRLIIVRPYWGCRVTPGRSHSLVFAMKNADEIVNVAESTADYTRGMIDEWIVDWCDTIICVKWDKNRKFRKLKNLDIDGKNRYIICDGECTEERAVSLTDEYVRDEAEGRPAIQDMSIYTDALAILRDLYGMNAKFRDGQYEAIEATIKNKRTLVVQRTGWGKSLVYFTATKLHRNMGRGMTLVISPLLILMTNQLEAAEKLGLKCEVINSTTKNRWEEILENAKNDKVDLILSTPESLFSNTVRHALPNLRLALMVIDEAHCISDWGHDFRLNYGNLYKVIKTLPPNVSLLGTTATANNRVIEDLKMQFGDDVFVSRGSLERESLHIQVLNLETEAERYAWLLDNLETIPGSGIIYCLTQRTCDYLADFLAKNGISARAYHAGLKAEEASAVEDDFKKNRIKAIVATIKLGMGYDKGDIAFVIHFQTPSNIVAYYQQIGRAGRNIDDAYVFLMNGKEDDDIINYFIDTAFPSYAECKGVLEAIENSEGLSMDGILSALNFRKKRIEKAIDFLQNEGCIRKDGSLYYITTKKFFYRARHYQEITEIRRREHKQMKALTSYEGCYSKYIVNCLDDFTATECGKCSNCMGRDIIEVKSSEESIKKAIEYINGRTIEIAPRKMWVESSVTKRGRIKFINQTGICLSGYGDPGYGRLVREGKYGKAKRFSAELVARSAEVLLEFIIEHDIEYLTFVPSKRSNIVEIFARELAEMLGIRVIDALYKVDSPPQKKMENSAHQCENAYKSFFVKDEIDVLPEKILLVDDMVDSKWTLTVCGYRLMEAGCTEVYPFALADSGGMAGGDEENE